jgi:hypothetical protein
MAAAGFLYGASKIKRRLIETYDASKGVWEGDGQGGYTPKLDVNGIQEMGANCRNGGASYYSDGCGFSGGDLMVAMFAIQ